MTGGSVFEILVIGRQHFNVDLPRRRDNSRIDDTDHVSELQLAGAISDMAELIDNGQYGLASMLGIVRSVLAGGRPANHLLG